jgi:ABC-type polysaccharide/polyol phosphate export permease
MVSSGATERAELLLTTPAADLFGGLLRWDLWGRLGWLEVKRRYRRTVLGPFWTSMSFAIFIATFGAVGAGLWNQPMGGFVVFLAAGMVGWLLIAAIMTEAGTVFVAGAGIIREIRLNYSILVYALVWRNFLVFLHHLAIFAVIFLLFSNREPDAAMLLAVPGILLIIVNGVWIALALGMFALRFRDMQQVVANIIQILMFVTPLFWPPDRLLGTSRGFLVQYNPVYYFIEIIRAPLLGAEPDPLAYPVVLGVTLVGWMGTLLLFQRLRGRIPYWT